MNTIEVKREVTSPGRQARIADDVLGSVSTGPWPGGLRAVTCLASLGSTRAADHLRGTVADPAEEGAAEVITLRRWTPDAAPAGRDTFREVATYGSPAPDPGLVVLVEVELASPDPDRQRRWIELVVAALETEPSPAAGLHRARFYAGDDGTRILNLAEWTSVETYDQALAAGPDGVAQADSPQWQAVRMFNGVRRNTVTRCQVHGAIDIDRAAIDALLEDYRAGFADLDAARLRSIWNSEQPSLLYIAQELAEPMRGWPAIVAYYDRVTADLRDATMTLGPTNVAVDDDHALADTSFTFHGYVHGAAHDASGRVTFSLRRTGAGWKAVAYHESALPTTAHERSPHRTTS